MTDFYRVRVKHANIEVEVESSDKAYVEAKLERYLTISPETTLTLSPKEKNPPTNAGSRRPTSAGEFIKKVNPDKKNEVAATLAYFLEYHPETPRMEWKPEEVASKFTDVRKSKPANMTDLLSKSNFFMEGREKGCYRLSETGVQWVEERMEDAA